MKALYVLRPGNRAGWYRCVLPAMFGGHDWAAIGGDPPRLDLHAGWVGGSTQQPDFLEYDVVVLQQAKGERWRGLIRKMRGAGVTVLYEIDDYVHGVRHAQDHDFRGFYQKHDLKQMEVCMRQCSGAIFSTPYLAERYSRLVRRHWVCENGLDLGRYRLTRPAARGEVGGRETVTILWAGATGHKLATLPWVYAVAEVMRRVPHASFVSIGQDFASLLADEFPDRTISVPFTSLECYPAAMMMGDVAIAPAGRSDWYRAKSDLRVMEAAALGIPVVADRKYSESVDDGATGLIATSPPALVGPGGDAVVAPGSVERLARPIQQLVEDTGLRLKMSDAARAKATTEFNMQGRVGQWEEALREAVSAGGTMKS